MGRRYCALKRERGYKIRVVDKEMGKLEESKKNQLKQ